MIILADKPTSCLNWPLIARDKFPPEFNNANVKEDFELLFQEQIDPVKLKETLRQTQRPPNQAVRKFLWKRILVSSCANPDSTTPPLQTTIEGYNKKISVLFGKNLKLKAEIPTFVDTAHLTFYYLNEDGKAAVCRVLNVLASVHPDITFAPLLLPLASLFLHYMNEAECYACLLAVCESKTRLTQTDMHWLTTNHMFRRFAQKYTSAAYEYLLEGVYRETNDPDVCFDTVDEWQWWIFECLPFDYVLNIVDSFLLEGQKVLLRFGLAILDLFYKSINSQQPRPRALSQCCVKEFCAHIQTPYDRLIKHAFGFRNISRRDVDSVFEAEEKLIKKLRAAGESNPKHEAKREQLRRLDQTPTGVVDITSPLTTLTCKLTTSSGNYKHKIYSKVVRPFLRSATYIANSTPKITAELLDKTVNDSRSSNDSQLLPEPVIASSANSTPAQQLNASQASLGSNGTLNGTGSKLGKFGSKKWYMNSGNASNHSFYAHHHTQSNLNMPSFSVENIGSSILTPEQLALIWRWLPTRYQILELQLIYSTNIHGCRLMTLFDKIEYYQATLIIILTTTRAIFGAFCSQPWSTRLPTGRMLRPAFFGNGESFLFELAPRVDKYEWVGKTLHGDTSNSQELFQYADKDKLIVGGGSESSSGMGLLIDSNLAYGRSGVSDTFKNKVLGNESDFEIAALEVLSFDVGQHG